MVFDTNISHKKNKILLVEDEKKSADPIIEILESNSYSVTHVNSGDNALEVTKSEVFDLILLDIGLPESIDFGYEVCERLKKRKEMKDVPIIFLTGKTDRKSIERGFNVGAVDYISKPSKHGELLARVKTHLDLKSKTKSFKQLASDLSKFIDKKRIEIEQLKLESENQKRNNNTLTRLIEEAEKTNEELKLIVASTKVAADKVIIFIHGLGGKKRKNRWEFMDKAIKNDKKFYAQYDIKFQEYPSEYIKWHPFGKSPSIQVLADDLKTLIEVECRDFKEIALVAHSMGGLIARQYIVDSIINQKPTNVNKLMLYATPNNGSQLAKLGILLQFRNIPIFQMKKKSSFIKNLNVQWDKLKVEELVKVKYIYGGKDRIVSKKSAIRNTNNSDYWVEIDKNHFSIGKPRDNSDRSYIILKKFVLNTSQSGHYQK